MACRRESSVLIASALVSLAYASRSPSRWVLRRPLESTLHSWAHGCVAGATDVDSFAVLEPTTDGFRNYLGNGHDRSAEELLLDRAHLLTLTAPEMTVLGDRMRALNANVGQSANGVFTNRPETLSNDFFLNLLDMNTK
jgi:hypothetical protein